MTFFFFLLFCFCFRASKTPSRELEELQPGQGASAAGSTAQSSNHAGRRAVQRHVPVHPHQGHVLHPTHSVLVLQQMGAVHRHLVHVLLHQDLQLRRKRRHQSWRSQQRRSFYGKAELLLKNKLRCVVKLWILSVIILNVLNPPVLKFINLQ